VNAGGYPSGPGNRYPSKRAGPWQPLGPAPHDETERTSVASTGHQRPRVLLVEDDPGARHFLRRILESEGIEVIGEAGHGARAIELVRLDPPVVVLMDLRMPGMGGIEATRAIKEVAPLTQVVILTVYEGPLPTRSAEQVGAYAYLVKGCSAELVRDVVLHAWWYKGGLEQRERRGRQA
jgi:CheY-like chemotaxis protein